MICQNLHGNRAEHGLPGAWESAFYIPKDGAGGDAGGADNDDDSGAGEMAMRRNGGRMSGPVAELSGMAIGSTRTIAGKRVHRISPMEYSVNGMRTGYFDAVEELEAY